MRVAPEAPHNQVALTVERGCLGNLPAFLPCSPHAPATAGCGNALTQAGVVTAAAARKVSAQAKDVRDIARRAHVGGLLLGQDELHRLISNSNVNIDLCARSALGTADGLIRPDVFPPAGRLHAHARTGDQRSNPIKRQATPFEEHATRRATLHVVLRPEVEHVVGGVGDGVRAVPLYAGPARPCPCTAFRRSRSACRIRLSAAPSCAACPLSAVESG